MFKVSSRCKRILEFQNLKHRLAVHGCRQAIDVDQQTLSVGCVHNEVELGWGPFGHLKLYDDIMNMFKHGCV